MSGGFGGYTVYFVARASTAWTGSHVWAAGTPASSTLVTAQGTEVGAAIAIPPTSSSRSACRSSRSPGARANLAAEVAAIDVEQSQPRRAPHGARSSSAC